MAEMLFVPDYDGAILVPENVGDFLCALAFEVGLYTDCGLARTAEVTVRELWRMEEAAHARTAEQLTMVEAERDVWSGKACEEEQAKGKGPCGACRHCLPALLKAAETERDELRRQLNSRNTPPGSTGFTPPWF